MGRLSFAQNPSHFARRAKTRTRIGADYPAPDRALDISAEGHRAGGRRISVVFSRVWNRPAVV